MRNLLHPDVSVCDSITAIIVQIQAEPNRASQIHPLDTVRSDAERARVVRGVALRPAAGLLRAEALLPQRRRFLHGDHR